MCLQEVPNCFQTFICGKLSVFWILTTIQIDSIIIIKNYFAKMKTWYFMLHILYVMGILNEVSSTSPDSQSQSDEDANPGWSQICQMQITTTINNRYSTTVVTKTVVSLVNTTMTYYFSHLIPNNAIITAFVIQTNNENYTSFVQDDEEARKEYDNQAIDAESYGSASARDTQKFSIPVDVEGNSITVFSLTYEELLKRNHGRYEYCLNIYPGQLVEDIRVEVHLKENSKIVDLEVPNLRTGNDIGNDNEDLDPQAFISQHRDFGIVKSAKVLFTLNKTEQINFARIMKTEEEHGFAGQFIVQYDVENQQQFDGDVIANDGYFVHFFAPKGLDPLTKHIVFVLDTSTSMEGLKIEQLKEAMKKLLNQVREDDLISLIQFHHNVKVWDLEGGTNEGGWFTEDDKLDETNFPKPSRATSDHIENAQTHVKEFQSGGGTDILRAIKVGLKLVELGRNIDDMIERQPIIMFLTDGEPTRGETSHEAIIEEVAKLNVNLKKSPISTLAFGDEPDKDFLHKLATLNSGFFKHIYEAEDSDLQIGNFYNTISVPVLTDVNIKYDLSVVSNISQTTFPAFYDGSVLVVTGKYDPESTFEPPMIEAHGAYTLYNVRSSSEVHNSTADISHHWAFVTVKQLLNDIKVGRNNDNEYKERVLKVSSKYSFVTDYSSMVIVKPNGKVVIGIMELRRQSTENLNVEEES